MHTYFINTKSINNRSLRESFDKIGRKIKETSLNVLVFRDNKNAEYLFIFIRERITTQWAKVLLVFTLVCRISYH